MIHNGDTENYPRTRDAINDINRIYSFGDMM